MIDNLFQSKILLGLILFLGLILRVVWINTSPPSLYGDELTIALDANSILNTGQDQLGNTLPLTFQMGAGRPAGYVYGSIPLMAIFGPTALGVRALSILSGLGIIILLYLVGRNLFSKEIGLAAAFIAAVSPWDIALSRGGFEAHFALLLAFFGIYLFIRAKETPLFYIFSALSFGITLHTYPTYKVSLLFFIPLLVWYVGFKKTKSFMVGVLLFLILAVAALSQTFIGGSETRFSDINIFSQDKLKNSIEQKINFERNTTNLSGSIAKYFYNKPTEYTKVFIENYLQNFSMEFLVLHGDRNPRHNMATMGQVYFAEMLLILVGTLTLWQKHRRLFLFLIFWLIIAPIPTAIIDFPHGLRSSFMLPPLIILGGLGLTEVLNYRKSLLIVLSIIFIIQFGFFLQKLYFLSPNEYSNFWSYSAKVASEQALQNKDKVKYIFLSDKIDSIEFGYPVYGKVDPLVVISQNKDKVRIGEFQFKKFDNVYIGHISGTEIQKFLNDLDGSALYIGTPDELGYLQNYQTINGKDKLPILIKVNK